MGIIKQTKQEREKQNIYHSQSSLKVFQKNPQLYKEIYIDNQLSKISIKNINTNTSIEKSVEEGINFHILADRYFNGIKDYFYIKDEKLLKYMEILEEYYPLEDYNNKNIKIKSEYEIKQDKENLKLLAKYDLLIINKENNNITIVDFKTNQKEYDKKKLEDDMQTIVYMYLLGENLENMNLNMKLEDIKMEYFQINHSKKKIIVQYSEKKHEKNKKILEEIIISIKNIK